MPSPADIAATRRGIEELRDKVDAPLPGLQFRRTIEEIQTRQTRGAMTIDEARLQTASELLALDCPPSVAASVKTFLLSHAAPSPERDALVAKATEMSVKRFVKVPEEELRQIVDALGMGSFIYQYTPDRLLSIMSEWLKDANAAMRERV